MLKSVSTFDASFFGMLPEQVNTTDPQLRILLEVAYEAIVDGGKALSKNSIVLFRYARDYLRQKISIIPCMYRFTSPNFI
ncbi:Fatty acid synthase [Holothuria leucospilota]|uniref:Fatty acid synthase n=1 Tax=Holothuria leucospilota TaxID=206669 RepID=A0A9Q1BPG3_HOLLE|nr:Fatty acid synthase [Holothuria leucospilota]